MSRRWIGYGWMYDDLNSQQVQRSTSWAIESLGTVCLFNPISVHKIFSRRLNAVREDLQCFNSISESSSEKHEERDLNISISKCYPNWRHKISNRKRNVSYRCFCLMLWINYPFYPNADRMKQSSRNSQLKKKKDSEKTIPLKSSFLHALRNRLRFTINLNRDEMKMGQLFIDHRNK